MTLVKKITTLAGVITLSAAIVGCGATKKDETKASAPKTEQKETKYDTKAPMVVKVGKLTGNGAEKSEGDVTIKDGKLMLTNFKTAKGPDLHVYLTKGKEVKTGKSLGKVDVDKAEQTFDLGDADLSQYDSVIIYCDKAHVTFGAADLMEQGKTTTATPAVMKTGVLTGNGAEKSEGDVTIKDGKVMLTNFKTAKGPDLHIYLTKGKEVKTGKSLGKVDVDKAEQTFDLGDADLSQYDSVIIYCDKAHVTFGAADLK